MQAGDILLYKHSNDLVSTLIAKCTSNGDKDALYSHVGVAVSDSHSIEAHSEDGVQIRNVMLSTREIVVVPILPFRRPESDVTAGLQFLQGSVGSKYSYADILDNLPFLKRLGISIVVQHRFDCSHLVADYIQHLNGPLATAVEKISTTTAVLSPNDIYRAIKACGGL